jgi:hypothetical protein
MTTNKDKLNNIALKTITIFTQPGFIQNMAKSRASQEIEKMTEVEALILINLIKAEVNG